MGSKPTRPAAILVGAYLLLTVLVIAPLIRDGYVGHGNGLIALGAAVLTSPLSGLLLLLGDSLSDGNAFYATGWPYRLTLAALGAGALLNAGLIYLAVTFIQRKRQRTRLAS